MKKLASIVLLGLLVTCSRAQIDFSKESEEDNSIVVPKAWSASEEEDDVFDKRNLFPDIYELFPSEEIYDYSYEEERTTRRPPRRRTTTRRPSKPRVRDGYCENCLDTPTFATKYCIQWSWNRTAKRYICSRYVVTSRNSRRE